MHVKSVVSAVALTIALGFSGAAFAQSTIGGMAIPEGELAAVQARCDQLNTAATTESLTEETTKDEEATQASDENLVDATPSADGASAVVIDLDLVTLDQCKEAALIK